MPHSCDNLDTTLARDITARKSSWFVFPGKSLAFVRFDSSLVPWVSLKLASNPSEDRSPESLFWHPRGVVKLRPILNQQLQIYFHKMQRITPRTCHPSIIHFEACWIANSVSGGLAGKPKLSGGTGAVTVPKALFRAGTVRLEYTRTVALLIYDLLVELNLSDWSTMRTLRIHVEDMATSSLLKAWSNLSVDFMFESCATGLEEPAHPLKLTRDAVFNTGVLYGDLVAVGIIPDSLLNAVVNGFLECLTSVSQCHLLYLLLVRATFHLAPPINSEYLLGWRKKLLCSRPTKIRLPIDDEMVQRWLIEICNVINKAVVKHQDGLQLSANNHSTGVNHMWDMKLTGQDLHELVVTALET